jgi:nucleotide-binding universal stress UspA family protein
MIGATRRSFESGHRPKFLVVVDETPECSRAIRFASRRCGRTGANLVMLAVVEPPDNFEWLGVGEVLRAEAEEEAASRLEEAVATAQQASPGLTPERVVKLGEKDQSILDLIAEDQDISFLVLASGVGSAGPGPLVSGIAGRLSGTFPVPIVIVPGDLADEAIDALAG